MTGFRRRLPPLFEGGTPRLKLARAFVFGGEVDGELIQALAAFDERLPLRLSSLESSFSSRHLLVEQGCLSTQIAKFALVRISLRQLGVDAGELLPASLRSLYPLPGVWIAPAPRVGS